MQHLVCTWQPSAFALTRTFRRSLKSLNRRSGRSSALIIIRVYAMGGDMDLVQHLGVPLSIQRFLIRATYISHFTCESPEHHDDFGIWQDALITSRSKFPFHVVMSSQ